jgi:tRNA A37 threonylcarbamoyladenosine dehydratase
MRSYAMKHDRCRQLFGDEDFARLQNAKILILGVGGVGSYALDCLYRSGITNITIVDNDTYEKSNQNRQIGSEAIGKTKVHHLATLYPGITPIEQTMDMAWVDTFDFEPYDLILDAADTTRVKIEIAKKHFRRLIMSLGSARRTDPTQIQAVSIWKSQGDALARKIRNELKKAKFDRNFTVIFSPENVKGEEKSSFVGVTGAFGLTMCSVAIRKIIEKPINP